MNNFLFISNLVLWSVVIAVGFLLWGTLRSLGLLQWQLDQLEATRPPRGNRSGLKPGAEAPDLTLPDVEGDEVSLSNFFGQRTLLVFVQAGCGPCHEIVPELNRLQRSGQLQVVVINRAELDEAREWVQETRADFPVLLQEHWEVSKQYQVFATPFAFLINERRTIASAGIVSSREYLGYLLDAAETFSETATDPRPSEEGTADRAQIDQTAEVSLESHSPVS